MSIGPYSLFLDDERVPSKVPWVELPLVEWRIVRTYKDFVGIITKEGLPLNVSYDHDLGDSSYQEFHRANAANEPINYDNIREKTGYDCAKWLVNYCIEHDLDLPKWTVHSWNPVGKKNIESSVGVVRKES
jgi:hypothetical protein